jgi:hypothetical protein
MRGHLDAYLAAFDAMRPDDLSVFDAVCHPEVRFVDPFNDVRGLERFKAVFGHMYATLSDPRFTVIDTALGADAAYLRWRFDFAVKGRPMVIDGMSEVKFAPDGRVLEHIDHWDAGGQVYAKLPLIGLIIRWVQRKLGI